MAAVAPDRRAASPSPHRATGRRWARTSAAEVRSPGPGAGPQQAQPGGRPAQGAGHEQAVPGPGPRAEQGVLPGALAERAEHGHRDHQEAGLRQVPAHHHAGGLGRRGGHPVAQPIEVGPGRRGDRDQGVVRPGPHGGQVGHRDHQGLVADVVRAAEVEIDVDPLDDQVGGQQGSGRPFRTRPGRPGASGPGRVEPGPGGPTATTAASSPIQVSPVGGRGPSGKRARAATSNRARSRSMTANSSDPSGGLAPEIPGIGTLHAPCLPLCRPIPTTIE